MAGRSESCGWVWLMRIMEGTHTLVRVSLAAKSVTHQSNIEQRDDHSDVDIQADAKPR